MQPVLPNQALPRDGAHNNQNHDPSDIVGALNGLIVALNASAAQNQQIMTIGHHLQNCVNYANALVADGQTFNQRLVEQQAAVANYQNIFVNNTQILNQQRELEVQQAAHVDLLNDALNAQQVELNTLFRELDQLGEQRVQNQLNELLREIGDGIQKKQEVKQKRDIAIVASLVFLAASTCLLPFMPAAGAAGVGCSLPGYKYARQSELEGKKQFKLDHFIKHIVVGGTMHLATSFVAGPIFADLSKKIIGTHLAGSGAVNVIDTLIVEAISKTTSQAILNATGMLLRKKLLGEKLSRSEIFYCMVAGSFGAAASFGVDKYADGIADVVGRIFMKGAAGFVNSAVAIGVDNLCHDRKWSDQLLQEGAEGFFWSIVFQTADEIRQSRFKKAEFEKTKKEILDEIENQQIPEEIKKKLRENISKAETLEDINNLLNDLKRQALIEEVQKKNGLSQEKKEELINELRNRNLGLHETIKNIYTKQIQGSNLPKELKDKMLEDIAKAQHHNDIKDTINKALQEIQEELSLGKLEGKTWTQVREQVRNWVKDLIDRGYHPTGDHLPMNMWKDPKGLDILVDGVLKHLQTGDRIDILVFTHHHHRVHIEIKGSKLVRYEYDHRTVKNIKHGRSKGLDHKNVKAERDFENPIVKPRELTPIRNRFQTLQSMKEFCDSIIAHLQEIQQKPGSTSSGLNKAVEKLKDISVSGLSSAQLHQLYKSLVQKREEAQKGNLAPAKLNFFASPWIGSGQHHTGPNRPNAQALVQPGRRNVPAAIRAPAFQAGPVNGIQSVQGFLPANLEALNPPPAMPQLPQVQQMALLGPVRPVSVEELQRAVKRQRHIAHLQQQIASCGKSKAGRAKKQQLQNQLGLFI
jgi:hypothetical protein